jgi:alpha-1,2-mannosyltransferase
VIAPAAHPLLGRRRLSYAWVAGGALWLAWLMSITLGRWPLDMSGQVVGTDYLQFYCAGYTLRLGHSPQLYDIAYQNQLEHSLIGPQLNTYFAFITPPFLAWLYQPLAAVPYGWSFAVWSLLGLAGLWASLRLLGAGRPWVAFAWSLTWFPVFASISYGQNSLLSLTLVSLTYALWRRKWALLAGLVCSLLMYKPQLLVGIALLWLLEAYRAWSDPRSSSLPGMDSAKGSWPHHWLALAPLAGLALGSAGLALLCLWQLPGATTAYLKFARTVLPDLPHWQQFPLWNLHTVRGFWQLLLPSVPRAADGLFMVCVLAALFVFLRSWRNLRPRALEQSGPEVSPSRWLRGPADRSAVLFAGAVAFTLCVTPHAMIYDWTLLLVPAVILWEHVPAKRPLWISLYAVIWLAVFLSGPLTYGQLHLVPFALQISVPALVFVLVVAYRTLMRGAYEQA